MLTPPPRTLALAAVLAFATAASAQLPQTRVYSVFPPGGQAGQTVEVKITAGADLDGVAALHFNHPGITAEPVRGEKSEVHPNAKPVPGQFKVTIGKDVPRGIYTLRAVGRFGVSNARAFVVDDKPTAVEASGNQTLEKAMPVPLNSTVFGTADARAFDTYAIEVKKGQRVVVECLAQQIDSRADATLKLLDPSGIELQLSRDVQYRDPVIDFTAKADGKYYVQVYDFLYNGGSDHLYQLRVHTGPYVDFVFPPVVEAGKKTSVTVFGRNLPGGSPSQLTTRAGQPLQQVTLDITAPATGDHAGFVPPHVAVVESFGYHLPSPNGASNLVRIGLAKAPVLAEAEPNDAGDKATKVKTPCEFVGRFDQRGDVDHVEFDAKKGESFHLELHSHRLGVPADPTLTIYQVTKTDKGETVKSIASNDDGPALGTVNAANNRTPGVDFNASSGDPVQSFTAPADGTYRVLIRDLYGNARNDPDHVYRLTIRPAQPDFQVVALSAAVGVQNKHEPAWDALLRKGSTLPIKVAVIRREGFNGAVDLKTEGLPKGVTCDPVSLPAWKSTTVLMLKAGDDAEEWHGPVKVTGTAEIAGKPVTRPAVAGEAVWMAVQNKYPGWSRVTGDFTLAVADQPGAPFDVALANPGPVGASRAGKFNLPIKITRRNDATGKPHAQDISLKAVGLPAKNAVTVKAVKIAKDKNEGQMEVALNTQAPLGTFSFLLYADTQFSYAHNKDQIEPLKKEKERIDALVKSLKEQAGKEADKDKKAALNNRVKAAEAAAKQAAADLKKVTDGSKPKNLKVSVPVTVVTLTVTAAPLELKPAAEIKVKQGEKVELPVSIQKLYGFDDAVTLELDAPKGVTGLKLEKPGKIDKGQADTKLSVIADKKATPGSHTFEVEAKLKYNGQNLSVKRAIKVVVEAAG